MSLIIMCRYAYWENYGFRNEATCRVIDMEHLVLYIMLCVVVLLLLGGGMSLSVMLGQVTSNQMTVQTMISFHGLSNISF